MVEVPAAVHQLEQLAQKVDFLSVGTNDLAQYLLASDRNNPRVSSRLHHYHPALLQALRQIAQTAARAGKPVTVCGEMANEPTCALLLLGMGYRALSISAMAIPRVKWAIRNSSAAQMRTLAAQVLSLDRPDHIHRVIEQALRGSPGSAPANPVG
jgi:phosphotransferase system enzyme I (PtsP)